MRPVPSSVKRILPLCVPLGAALLAVLCLSVYALRARVTVRSAREWADAGQRASLKADAGEPRVENGLLVLEGWALDEGVEYESYNWGNGGAVHGPWNDSCLALLDQDSGRLYLLPTQAGAPEAEGDWLPDDGLDYGRCRLSARAPVSGLPGRSEVCVTFVLPDGSRYLYHTGREVVL